MHGRYGGYVPHGSTLSPIAGRSCYLPHVTSDTPASPEALRTALAGYVRAMLQEYAEASQSLALGDRARQPLLSAPDFTVVAAATRHLHLLGTTSPLPAAVPPEIPIPDAVGPMTWTLRFLDASVVPSLAAIDESEGPQPAHVRAALGIPATLFHLTVSPGSGLSAHHAQHAGTGLAHAHARASIDYRSIAALLPQKEQAVRELAATETADLALAHSFLAESIVDGGALDGLEPGDYEDIRRAVLAVLRT